MLQLTSIPCTERRPRRQHHQYHRALPAILLRLHQLQRPFARRRHRANPAMAREARRRPRAPRRGLIKEEDRDGQHGAPGHRLLLRELQPQDGQAEGADGQGGRGVLEEQGGHDGGRHGVGADCEVGGSEREGPGWWWRGQHEGEDEGDADEFEER